MKLRAMNVATASSPSNAASKDKNFGENPSPQPPPRSREGEKDSFCAPSPLRGGGWGEGFSPAILRTTGDRSTVGTWGCHRKEAVCVCARNAIHFRVETQVANLPHQDRRGRRALAESAMAL